MHTFLKKKHLPSHQVINQIHEIHGTQQKRYLKRRKGFIAYMAMTGLLVFGRFFSLFLVTSAVLAIPLYGSSS